MSDKKKLIAIVVFLILFLAASVFFCIYFKWWCVFIPSIFLIILEISCRIWLARHAIIPTLYKKGSQLKACCLSFQSWLKSQGINPTQSSNATVKTGTHGGQQNTPIAGKPLEFISAIKDLKLTDYIKCIGGDLSPIIIVPRETYTREEIEATGAAWLLLRSEYEVCRKDKREIDSRRMQLNKTELEVREKVIWMLTESLRLMYSPLLIDKIRFYHPDLKWTKETYLQDLKIVGNKESRNRENLKELQTIIDKEGKRASDNQTTEESFHSYINAYNRAFKTTFSLRNLWTDEYAYMCADYDKYCADLKKEYDKTSSRKQR